MYDNVNMQDWPPSTLESLFDKHGPVLRLVFDEEFDEHMADPARDYRKHRVTVAELQEVLEGAPLFAENPTPTRRAPVIMVGPTDAGRLIVAPLEPTHESGLWRPVTAFEANAHQRLTYEQRVRAQRGG